MMDIDHETSGAQEWQLVGYGGRPVRSATPAPATSQIVNKPEPQKASGARPATPSRPTRQAAATRGAPRARASGAGRGRWASPRKPTSTQPSQLFRDSPAKSKWRNGSKPSGIIPLPTAFGTFKYEFLGAAITTTFERKGTRVQGRSEVFEDICKRTGAFVQPPAYTDQVIQVWGEPNQVAAAEEQIKALLAKCATLNKSRKKGDFAKLHAYSTKKETKLEFEERGESLLQHLRMPPLSGTFSEQLLFLWPKDGPSLNQSLGPQLEYLDRIRAEFGCHLFAPKDLPGYICALGHNSDSMKEIAQRLRILWAEIVAKSNVKAKVYLVEPPEPSTMEAEIIVKKENNMHKAALQGGSLMGHDREKWNGRVGLIRSRNNDRLLAAVENCLRGVSFVRGHVRMRVNLGTFVLEKYQLPEDEKSWYGFEEFREMLLHEQTKGRLIPGLKACQSDILGRCFKAAHLFETCDGTSTSLESAELAYSVNFEFLGEDKSMLRLEAEFGKSPGAREYEIKERRWLRPRDSGQSEDKWPPLHAAVIDFGRSDWQLEMKLLDFHETSSIDTALKSFSHSIGFRTTEAIGDISAKPRKKVTFPESAPVSRFVEKSALRYRVKGTNYIFEIARYDEYKRASLSVSHGPTGTTITGPSMSDEPLSTSWGASVFDPNWDILLGDHANLALGHSANYTPNLLTFFPPKGLSPGLQDGSRGFWEFIDLVKQVAEILGPTGPSSVDTNVQTASDTRLSALEPKDEVALPVIPSSASATGSARMLNADLGTLF